MDIELGIQNVARTVTFSTEQSADEVNAAIADAVENGKTINLTSHRGAGRLARLRHHRFRNQARRRFRQPLTRSHHQISASN